MKIFTMVFAAAVAVISGVVLTANVSATPPVLAVIDDVRVTVLSDMTVSRWTHGEWGFAALVEVQIGGVWKKILFDTGAEPGTVVTNVDRMARLHKINDANGNPLSLCDVETVVLSHNHQDHSLGLVEIRRRCGNKNALAKVYVGGPEIFWSRPTPAGEKNVMLPGTAFSASLGISPDYDAQGVKQLFEAGGGQFIIPPSNRPMALPEFPGVWITAQIPRPFDEKTYPGTPVVNPQTGEASPDIVPEDQALVINTSKGLVVIAGCAHAGLVNTLLYAKSMLGQTLPIYAVLGGYHLLQMKIGDTQTPGTLAWTAAQLGNFGIHFLLGAHCTGLEAFAYVRQALGLDALHAVYSTVATEFSFAQGIKPPTGGLNAAPEP